MKEFWGRLNAMERRFVVGVAVAFFLVGNVVFVWPHFGEFSDMRTANTAWHGKLDMFNREIDRSTALKDAISKYQREEGQSVPPQETAVQFFRLIQNQAAASGVGIINMGSTHQTGTNQFFVEQNQTITTTSDEKQLVDFLYHLGAGQSLIRVRVLSIQPDPPHQKLTARITLVASYRRTTPAAKAAAAPGAATPAAATAKPGPPPVASKPAPAGPSKAAPPIPMAPKPNPLAPKPNPLLPRQGPLAPMNRGTATNRLSPLTPNKK